MSIVSGAVSTSTTTGSLQVDNGGIGCVGNIWVGGNTTISGNLQVFRDVSLNANLIVGRNVDISGNVSIGGNIKIITSDTGYGLSVNSGASGDPTNVKASLLVDDGGIYCGGSVVVSSTRTLGLTVKSIATGVPTSTNASLIVDSGGIYNQGNIYINSSSSSSIFTNGNISCAKDILCNGLTIGKGLGNRNTIVGDEALNQAATSSSEDNTAMGYQALTVMTNASSNNTAYGSRSLVSMTNANNNTAYGSKSLANNIIGNANTSIGFGTLYKCLGINNTAIGFCAGNQDENVSNNSAAEYINFCTFLGSGAGTASVNGTYTSSTAIGANTKLPHGSKNQIYIGTNNETVVINGNVYINNTNSNKTYGLYVGSTSSVAAESSTTGSLQVDDGGIGCAGNIWVGGNLSVPTGNVYVGGNLYIGIDHQIYNTNSPQTTIVNKQLINVSQGMGSQTTIVGYDVLTIASSTSWNNTAMGHSALAKMTTGNNNTAYGSTSLNKIESGSNNTSIGFGTLAECTGINNTAIGYCAGDYIDYTSAAQNINFCTFLGSGAGTDTTTGTYTSSTAIGANTKLPEGSSHKIYIGTLDETVIINGNVYINNTNTNTSSYGLYVGSNNSGATSSTTGSLLVDNGGIGCGGSIYAGGTITINTTNTLGLSITSAAPAANSTNNSGSLRVDNGGIKCVGDIYTGGNITINTTNTLGLSITSAAPAASTTTSGSLQVDDGGIGCNGPIFCSKPIADVSTNQVPTTGWVKDTIANNSYILPMDPIFVGNVTAQSFNATSDYRLKSNVMPLNGNFIVDNLRPVSYNFKQSDKIDVGFLAHEVQEEFPFLVSGEKDGENTQSINYNGFIGILVKEMQDSKKEMQDLKTEIINLKLRIALLEPK